MGDERMLQQGILPDRVQASEPAIASYYFFMHPAANLNDSESSSDGDDSGDNTANASND
jgi:hypothetical protein